jgi:hypothetical protein
LRAEAPIPTRETKRKKRKKNDFFTKPSPKLSFTLKIVFETGIANANPRRSLNLNASNNKKNRKNSEKKGKRGFSGDPLVLIFAC